MSEVRHVGDVADAARYAARCAVNALNAARAASVAAHGVVASRHPVYSMTGIADTAQYAAAAADATRYAAQAAETAGVTMAAARAARAAETAKQAALAARRAADKPRYAPFTVMWAADAAYSAARAAVRAAQVAQRAAELPPEAVPEALTVRPLGRLSRRIVRLTASLLPAGDRARYSEEWLSDLYVLNRRHQRALYLIALIRGSLRLAIVLRGLPPRGTE